MPGINKKKKLLLVDDNIINIKILTKIFQEDYELITANNGRIALDILFETVSNPVDAVVLDIVMPVMDGYEVLKRMRSDSKLNQIPVIVASGQDSDNEKNREIKALSLGANDYVTKPYNIEIIKHRIANAIYLRETAAFVNTVQNDALTGIYSKEYFYLQVEKIKKKNPNGKYDMVCCDIENFKLVNDLYGTNVGDHLLKCCADNFKSAVGKQGICGRIGADVFAFFIVQQKIYNDDMFIKKINEINEIHINLNIQIKYGIYAVDDFSVPANLLCDRAKLAIADIKGKYGVYFRYYDDSIRKKMLNEQYITSKMKNALEKEEFEVYFQPKYELKTQTIIGAEALIRWNDPEKGFLSPADFVPLFEKNGFITDLDCYVWETCCQKIRSWIDRGNVAIPVSVNVSRTDLLNPKIEKIFLSLLRKYNLSPKYMYLEITESTYTENSQQIIEAVIKLKKLGFKIEMDDFGTGYSSLNMLSELPIDVVKLDIGFIQNQQKFNNRSILSFIISLAKWMNLGVISEGVETAEQVALLRSLGCECAQGFYFARPMPANKFEELLIEQFEKHPDVLILSPDKFEQSKTYYPSSVLVIDKSGKDYAAINSLFSDEFKMYNITTMDDFKTLLLKMHDELEVVIFTLDRNQGKDMLKEIISYCKPFSIPVMAIIPSAEEIDVSINLGVNDYILKPFNEIGAKNRIQNIINSTKVSRFEIENEINSVILDMKKRAERDSLTGLLNRAEFENTVQQFFHDNKEPDGYFIMLDVDNFKFINDNYGHVVGDDTLQAIAKALYTIFPETEIISRMGGDEFSIFIPYLIDKDNLEIKVRKLCNTLDFKVDKMKVSCSVGICRSPINGQDFQTLYENADSALLLAKHKGKSQFCYYQMGMKTPTDESFENKAKLLLDNTSDAMFVCDAISSELIYINDTACNLIGKSKQSCIGCRCYQLFWDSCKNCDRCSYIDQCSDCFYEEDTIMKDGKTAIHIKAKVDTWDGRRVKIHYLQPLNKL